MKTLLIAVLMVFALFANAYDITVYGRNSCGFTQNLRNSLTAEGIYYTYCNVDSSACLGQLFSVAVEFNLAVDGVVNLPVVLVIVNEKRYGYVRPSIATIMQITTSEVTRSPTIVYPNPADKYVTIDGDCEIYDLNGLKLIESNDRNVLVEGLKPGVYVVRVRGKMIKLIKQ